MIVCEHISSPWPSRGTITGYVLQKVWVLAGWNLVMGGCELNRDTVGALRAAGGKSGWKKFDLEHYESWSPSPYVVGELVKSEA